MDDTIITFKPNPPSIVLRDITLILVAPLETLASGMTPIIPKRSGTWTDTRNNEEYCYNFTKPEPRR